MKQLVQNFKTGELAIEDVPPPALQPGMVLVRNLYSLISIGTERSTIDVAKASLIGKAKKRPDLVKQVLTNIKKEGLKATIDKVQNRLESPKALGYSSAGVVVGLQDLKNRNYQLGQLVACGGQDFASHAEIVAVPEMLTCRVPEKVSARKAAFTTLGAIAMQGVRQSDPKLGEKICVIGLGPIGQITCQLVRANGCRVFGLDLSEPLIKLAQAHGVHQAAHSNAPELESLVDAFTSGHGFDSVIITAGTASSGPVSLAAKLARKRGKIVVVGNVGMNLEREPYFYKKELSLHMSCSYGPGRYDPSYELKARDYPYSYVRWTEQRNMEAFLDLIADGRLPIDYLITQEFELDKAQEAYDLVLGRGEQTLSVGILLKYPGYEYDANRSERLTTKFENNRAAPRTQGDKKVAFVGAGNFAQSYLLPWVKKAKGFTLETVMTSKGITAQNIAKKFGFNNFSTDLDDIVGNKDIEIVFVATQHHLHSSLARTLLASGKKVFLEKPLTIDRKDFDSWCHDGSRAISDAAPAMPLMIGYNRRFSEACKSVLAEFKDIPAPIVMNYRVNAGRLPPEHWIQDVEVGGGRILGEICHFVDFAQAVFDDQPKAVYASGRADGTQAALWDNLSIVVSFCAGHTLNLSYLSHGDTALPKERVEIFGGGKTVVVDDFKGVTIYAGGKRREIKVSGKGHREEVELFLARCHEENAPMPISMKSLLYTSAATFSVIDSLEAGGESRIALESCTSIS